MRVFEGKNGIKATIICDSICNGVRLTTMEVEYPRIIHAEVMTHRMFSRNAASSRAIPFEKMLKQLTGKPVRFGANQAGMQDSGEHEAFVAGRGLGVTLFGDDEVTQCLEAEEAWETAREDAIFWSKAFSEAGYHKQICNRLTEPYQMIKVLISATEWDNFFWLRRDEAADPTLQELARVMQEAQEDSTPFELRPGEWHLPYIAVGRCGLTDNIIYFETEPYDWAMCVTKEEAIKISAARSAAVSYRNVDYSLEKSKEVYDRLVGAEKKHGSALEHQATPMEDEYAKWDIDSLDYNASVNVADSPYTWQKGISHMDKNCELWSANFKGWVQHRKLLTGENHTGE